MFRPWADHLPAAVEVWPLQLPGRGRRLGEAPFTHLRLLVEVIAQAMLPHLDKDFIFFGHSMGALIAFELARFLRREHGREPVHLVVSARNAPHIPDRKPPTYNLPEDEFLKELHRLNGTPKDVLEHPELLKLIRPCVSVP